MTRFHPLTVKDVRKETDDSVAVTFAVPDALKDNYRFIQGQHLTLKARVGDDECRRSYSICSGVDDGLLRVAIKRLPGGLFSNFANDDLKPGTVLDVMTPMGQFFTALDPDAAKTYVAFVAGSGITPVLSIIKTVLAREPKSRFLLFYGNRTLSSIMFREELEDLKNTYLTRFSIHHILSREQRDADLLNGRIDGARARALLTAFAPAEAVDDVFLCGPQSMIEDVSRTLEDMGLRRDHIHFELFHTETSPREAFKPVKVDSARDAARITIVLNGVRREFDLKFNSDSILDAAQAHGADVPFSCKGGVCCTCRAKVVEGKVDMALNYALEPHEVEQGFVLTCQSRPLTDRVVVDYDEA